MEIALFIFYLVLLSVTISKVPFFQKSGIGTLRLIAVFTIKILAGIAYAKFYTLPKYYAGSDTWRFFRLSLSETKWLLTDPVAFVKDLFVHGYSDTGNIFKGENTYWNDLKSNVPVKLMAVMNVFTNNSYYCNIIFFNFLFLFGLVALFKVLIDIFPGKKNLVTIGLFLLPSTLFWCSGIHKDGLILSATGLIIYAFFLQSKAGFSVKWTVISLLCMLLIFSLRNYVLFALLPCLFALWLTTKYPSKKLVIFTTIFATGIAALFILPFVFPSVNLPLFIVEKQNEFLQLEGGSQVVSEPLQPSFAGFITFLPHALDMAFLRPHITEFRNLGYLPAIVETLLIILLVLASALSAKHIRLTPLTLFLFAFSLAVLLLCGYTIPFTGAIVRYRSFVLPLVVTPLLCMVRLPQLRRSKKK